MLPSVALKMLCIFDFANWSLEIGHCLFKKLLLTPTLPCQAVILCEIPLEEEAGEGSLDLPSESADPTTWPG